MYLRGILVLAGLVATAVAAFYVARFWKNIREQVATWLREQKLEKSILMDAWIQLDKLIGAVKCRLFVKLKSTEETKMISEMTYQLDEIDDFDVLKKLEERGSIERKDIMEYLE
jgi:hypothetical protein